MFIISILGAVFIMIVLAWLVSIVNKLKGLDYSSEQLIIKKA